MALAGTSVHAAPALGSIAEMIPFATAPASPVGVKLFWPQCAALIMKLAPSDHRLTPKPDVHDHP
ncbi:hypothetical protein, partial [Frankia sp. Cppng1_Ct_nod]|uniref:hypothetical protein n=1 Tax=Frankia sp. Cppng1_Ct_nod TaxID=2897162 RepID=UPI0020241E76